MPARVMDDRELLGRLVAVDSTSHRSNLPVVELLEDYLGRPGVRLERVASAAGDKANLLVSVGPEVAPDSREGLMLSGHLDTVPAVEEGWRSDPFTLTEVGDRLVARGSADMKGFVALAANLAAELAPRAGRLRRPLVLLFTYDEEVGTLGARRFSEVWPRERPLPRQAVIGEPTSLRPVRMHKGHVWLRVTVEGASAHSGYPHLGRNAIEPAARAIAALAKLREELARERGRTSEHFPEVPFVALNVARVEGGTAVNIVPDRCVIDVGVRHLPGMDAVPLVARLSEAIDRALHGERHAITVENESPPLLLSESSAIHRHAVELVGEGPGSVSFATDAGWLAAMDVECLIFGPGSIEVAHKPNEHLGLDELRRGAELLRRLVGRHTGEE